MHILKKDRMSTVGKFHALVHISYYCLLSKRAYQLERLDSCLMVEYYTEGAQSIGVEVDDALQTLKSQSRVCLIHCALDKIILILQMNRLLPLKSLISNKS